MSKAEHWFPLYVGDYLSDTGHLSTSEHGAYLLLLMHQWRHGCVPADEKQLSKITRQPLHEWRRMAGTILAFFSEGEGGVSYVQGRLERERNKADEHAARRSEKARKAASSRWNSEAKPDARSMLGASPEHVPSNAPRCPTQPQPQEKKEDTSSLRSDGAVPAPLDARTQLFRTGLADLRHVTGLPDGRARALLGKCLKAAGDNVPVVAEAIARCVDARPADPVPWLLQACQASQFRNGFLAVIAAEGWGEGGPEPEEARNPFLIGGKHGAH